MRQNRRTDLGLFISRLVCTITGLLWLLLPQANPNLLERWSSLHTMSGLFIIVLMGVHLLLHWGWMVKTARQLRNQQHTKTNEQIAPSGG